MSAARAIVPDIANAAAQTTSVLTGPMSNIPSLRTDLTLPQES